MLNELAADSERYLAQYAERFGNVLNADDAATLFDEYNQDRARYRLAMHRPLPGSAVESRRCAGLPTRYLIQLNSRLFGNSITSGANNRRTNGSSPLQKACVGENVCTLTI